MLLPRFLRQSSEKGLPELMRHLEWMRERVTVQSMLAERDFRRR